MPDILGIGTSGLLAFQKKLNIIGHNISNVSTEGYSRQVTHLKTGETTRAGDSLISSGVRISATKRVADDLVTAVYHENTSIASEASIFYGYASRINELLSDESTGVNESVSNFFDALQNVNQSPSQIPSRRVFLDSAKIMVSKINNLNSVLDEQVNLVNRELATTTQSINGLAKSIARLNDSIQYYTNLGANSVPNDLLDQRDEALRELSSYTDIRTVHTPTGSTDVFLSNGVNLVLSDQFSTLETTNDPNDASRKNVIVKSNYGDIDVTDQISGGSIGALLRVRSEIIDSVYNTVNRVANSLAMAFNIQHQKGIDLTGSIGKDFFNEVNILSAKLNRSISDVNNKGTGLLEVELDPIDRVNRGPYEVFSSSSGLLDAGSLTGLSVDGKLTLNGIKIRATTASDDTVSPSGASDNLYSAIATANAINDVTGHGIFAKAMINNLYLGTFTQGSFAAGEFQINGVDVVSTGIDEETLLQDINALTLQTGVRAVGDSNLGITLIAEDGRNIQLTSNTNTPVATFTNFDTSSATALNKVQRAEVMLFSEDEKIKITGISPIDVGFVSGTYPNDTTSLTDSDYQVDIRGTNVVITRLSDNSELATTSTTDFIANGLKVDGFNVKINNGTLLDGDSFRLIPNRGGASNFSLKIKDLTKMAFGCPVTTSRNINNKSEAKIEVDKILNTSGVPAGTGVVYGNAFSLPNKLSPPIKIVFESDTRYNIYDVSNGEPGVQIGPTQTYDLAKSENQIFPISSLVDKTGGVANPTYIWDPGYRVKLTGTPAKGDSFTISYNSNPGSDNRNGLELAKLQDEKLVEDNSSSFQEVYFNMVSRIGSTTRNAQNIDTATDSLLRGAKARRDEMSGVNLDEELAELIRFQQAYQASAQVISISRTMFDKVLNMLS